MSTEWCWYSWWINFYSPNSPVELSVDVISARAHSSPLYFFYVHFISLAFSYTFPPRGRRYTSKLMCSDRKLIKPNLFCEHEWVRPLKALNKKRLECRISATLGGFKQKWLECWMSATLEGFKPKWLECTKSNQFILPENHHWPVVFHIKTQLFRGFVCSNGTFLQLDRPIAAIHQRCLRCKDIKRTTPVTTLVAMKSGLVQDVQIIQSLASVNDLNVQDYYTALTGENELGCDVQPVRITWWMITAHQ